MIAVLGGSGELGGLIVRHFREQGETVESLSRKELDYTDPVILGDYLRKTKPSFLINAAGFTGRPNVDQCEEEKTACLAANAVLPGTIREVCETRHLPWAHISSGCIYRGRREDGGGFREDDAPNFSFRHGPCSFYSGCKALGEEMLEGAENCYIWRLRMPFSHRDEPRNLLSKLLRYDTLLDAENSLTHVDEFAAAALFFARERPDPGIYHLVNGGATTTRRIAAILKQHVAPDREFRFFPDEKDFLANAAVAPRSNCVLDNSRILDAGFGFRPVEEALVDAASRWEPAN